METNNQAVSQPETDSATRKDWVLETLVTSCNIFSAASNEIEIPVTLTVNGLIISGFIISGKRYFELLGEPLGEDSVGGIFKNDIFKKIALTAYGVDKENKQIDFIHLRRAFISNPNGLNYNQSGTLWRGKIADINGWYLGAPEEVKKTEPFFSEIITG